MTEDKKAALKAAALDIFGQKGYKATGISEIARQAKVAVGSFYNYYDSKEAIFLDVYIEENKRIRQKMMKEIDWQGEAVDLVGQLFAWSRKLISPNKILSEWYNPAISDYLRSYYASRKRQGGKHLSSVFDPAFYRAHAGPRLFQRKNPGNPAGLPTILLHGYAHHGNGFSGHWPDY